MSACPTSSRWHALTAALPGDRPSPRPNTYILPTVCRSRAKKSTLLNVHLSPLPDKGVLDATGLQALQRAYTSKVHGTLCIKLFILKARSCHRVAHPTAHRREPCEICGVVKILRSEDVPGDEVVGEAGEGLARVERRRGCRGSDIGSMCIVGGHRGRGLLLVCVVQLVMACQTLGRYEMF